MTANPTPDGQLVGTYARDGSEAAFRALVERHVGLVFAAAHRQLGDVGRAEEVVQDVFVALARKAPRLAGHRTLAGWLHRTAVLEAKARQRAECRRRRREEVAHLLETVHAGPADNPADELTPLLDEALLGLREADRTAVMLRYLEERSLREVGHALGIDEDAARKRVSRALARLADFFRSRGIALPAAGAAGVIGNAVQAAPSGLAATAGAAGLAAGNPGGAFALVWLHLSSASPFQAAVLCTLLAAAPLAWQSRLLADARGREQSLREALALETAGSGRIAERVGVLRGAADRARADRLAAEARLAAAASPLATAAPVAYRWDDRSTLVRVPKALLRTAPLEGVTNRQGGLSRTTAALLQFREAEAQAVQSALDRFVAAYQAALQATTRRVEPDPTLVGRVGAAAPDIRVFEVRGLGDRLGGPRDDLFAAIRAALGPERSEVFIRSLGDWMPVDDEPRGLNSGQAVLARDHRFFFVNPVLEADGERFLGHGITLDDGSFTRVSMAVRDIPAFVRVQLQDWLDAGPAALPAKP